MQSKAKTQLPLPGRTVKAYAMPGVNKPTPRVANSRPALHLNKAKVEPFDGLASSRRNSAVLPDKLDLSHVSLQPSPKYRVVFDIDDTLMCMLGDISNTLRFPPSHVFPVQGALYYIFPDFAKVFITLLCWGWGVDFFSLGTQMRNHELVPLYLKTILKPYHPSEIAKILPRLSEPTNAVKSSDEPTPESAGGAENSHRKSPKAIESGGFAATTDSSGPDCDSSQEHEQDRDGVGESDNAADRHTAPCTPPSTPASRSLTPPSPPRSRVIKLSYASDIPQGHGIHAMYRKICRLGRFRIFSRHQALHLFGNYTKDLRIMTTDVNNAILIDDDRANASRTGGQLPLIGVCYRDLAKNNQLGRNLCIEENGDNIEEIYGFNPLDNAAYIMGILLCCKDLLDDGKATTLRGALDLVLRHRGRSLIDKDTSVPGAESSKWYMQPYREYELAKLLNVKREDMGFHRQKQQWIERGRQHFAKYF